MIYIYIYLYPGRIYHVPGIRFGRIVLYTMSIDISSSYTSTKNSTAARPLSCKACKELPSAARQERQRPTFLRIVASPLHGASTKTFLGQGFHHT